MSDNNDQRERQGQLRLEAATWFARMRGPEAENHKAEFEAWLARGALHRSAYNRIAETFSAGKLLKDGSPDGPPPNRTASSRALLVVGVLLLFALFGLYLKQASPAVSPISTGAPVQLVSVIGQTRRIGLLDGSVVTLDSDSLVSVRMTRSIRLLRLERGRARFDVHHERRPFTVIAGDDRIVAHGTVFDVGLRITGGADVALLRGVIEVTKVDQASERPNGQSVMLQAGQRLVTTPRSTLPKPVAIGDEPNWTRQLVSFDRAPLSQVIADANRENIDRIVIPDPAVARLRVSGTFRLVDALHLSQRLAALFDLVVETPSPGVIILRRKTGS